MARTPAGATESESNRTATDSRPDRIRHNTSTSTRAAHRTSYMSPAKADGHAGQTLGLRYGAARDDVDTGQSNRKQKRLNSNRQPTRGQDCGRTSYTHRCTLCPPLTARASKWPGGPSSHWDCEATCTDRIYSRGLRRPTAIPTHMCVL